MSRNKSRLLAGSIHRVLAGSIAAGASVLAVSGQALAQDTMGEIVVTGTRITMPGTVSSSPVYSVTAGEIDIQQQPEVEKIIRLLPISAPSDGQNVNNGTAGASTVNLRGLGAQRNLVLIDGKRLTPYNHNGLVDVSMIPTALIERIDIVTGGASAVYGSDAISGALNFVMKKDFEGVELETNYSETDESDGGITNLSATVGGNFADGRGNMVVNLNYSDRKPVLLGARPLGQLGIGTASGSNYQSFLDGQAPAAPADPGCQGPGSVVAGGSGTTLPTVLDIAGGSGLGQFRQGGELGTDCSVFNFNPFNYYQTPLERFGGTAMGHFEVNEHAEVYTRFNYGSTSVRQQIAPSGVFGTPFWTPLSNPFITDQALGVILAGATADLGSGLLNDELTNTDPDLFNNWRDINGDGAVDEGDELNLAYFRRTVEFGPRSTNYDNENWQLLLGTRGVITGDWDYDVAVSYGETNRTIIDAGYTNVANIANAMRATDVNTCEVGGSCVPLNLFGGFEDITPEMAAYSSATAFLGQTYEQLIVSGSVTGPVDVIKLPTAESSLAVSFGAEYRDEKAATIPDECKKLAPASCLGGAGGNTLPIVGGYRVNEVFGEAIMPLVSGMTGIQGLDLEMGYRWSDYNLSGSDETWKVGLNWRPVESVLVRVMQQQAARAPNVGELAAPQVTALDNAQSDPCSVTNAANIDAALEALCISTGMSAPQVGVIGDLIAGQINAFAGTDLNNLPDPESADTLTAGIVWTPNFGGNISTAMFSIDYYNIEIDDVIGEFSSQEILDGCYEGGLPEFCDKVVRVGGNLLLPGSGIELFTTNLLSATAEGIEVGFALGLDLAAFGNLTFSGQINHYLTQETQSSLTTPVIDCNGYYGTSCGLPLSTDGWVQRTTWDWNDFTASLLWRHKSSVWAEPPEAAGVFEPFRKIDSYDYLDLYFGYRLFDMAQLGLGVTNVTDEDPPVVGNEAGSTTFNSGNTFPANYDTLGRVYSLSLNVKF